MRFFRTNLTEGMGRATPENPGRASQEVVDGFEARVLADRAKVTNELETKIAELERETGADPKHPKSKELERLRNALRDGLN